MRSQDCKAVEFQGFEGVRLWALLMALYPLLIWILYVVSDRRAEYFQSLFVIDAAVVAVAICGFAVPFMSALSALSAVILSSSLCVSVRKMRRLPLTTASPSLPNSQLTAATAALQSFTIMAISTQAPLARPARTDAPQARSRGPILAPSLRHSARPAWWPAALRPRKTGAEGR